MFYHVLVVGAGGTGGNLIKELGRYLYSSPNKESISLSIADGDRVEERNISRQPFIEEDIGEYKSVAMSFALQEVFGLNADAYTDYILSPNDLEKIFPKSRPDTVCILIGCVDNHHARKVMHQYFTKTKQNVIYIDAANEFSCGEVVVAAKIKKQVIGKDRVYYYPNLFRGKLKTAEELSCQELNEIAPQHLATNLLAANIVFSQAISAIEGRVNCGIYYFDAFTSQIRFLPYTKEEGMIDAKRRQEKSA